MGHETDFTIVDFVADLRAPTPSAAAAAAVPDRWELIEQLRAVQTGLIQRAGGEIDWQRERLDGLRSRLHRASPQRQIDLARQRLVDREERLHRQMAQHLAGLKERLAFGQVRLESLNPTAVLGRGYSIVQQADGRVVTGPAGAATGDLLRVRGAGGEYGVRRA